MAATLAANPLLMPVTYGEICYSSGSSTSTTSPSGQQSPLRTRRNYRSSSSSSASPEQSGATAWDRFTEEDLRAGGPDLCIPPVETIRQIPRNTAQYIALTDPRRHHYERLCQIASDGGIEVEEIVYCGRRSRFAVPQTQPRLTVLVFADRRARGGQGRGGGGPSSSWITITRQMLAYLTSNGILNVPVEIVDSAFDQRPNIFPCHCDDPVFSVWARVGPIIVESINLSGVVSVGCYRVGMSSTQRDCPVTILVGVDALVQCDWVAIRETIIRVLDAWGLQTVGVLLRWDGVWLGARDGGNDSSLAITFQEEFGTVTPGTSLKPRKMKSGTGTFGGWVQIRGKDRVWKTLGITCTHCVLPPEEEISDKETQDVRRWKSKGIGLGDAQARGKLVVDAPTREVVEAKLKRANEKITEICGNTSYKQLETLVEADIPLSAGDRHRWAEVRTKMEKRQREAEICQSMLSDRQYVFGHVVAASGLRMLGGRSTQNTYATEKPYCMDWALVQPFEEKPRTNQISRPTSFIGDFIVEDPSEGDSLFKVGAVSGATKGEYSLLDECKVTKAMVNGHEITTSTWEHTIVVGDRKCLVAPGDSGSLVLNVLGRVVGLIFAGSKTEDRGFYIRSADLIKDIKEQTGAIDVRMLPAF